MRLTIPWDLLLPITIGVLFFGYLRPHYERLSKPTRSRILLLVATAGVAAVVWDGRGLPFFLVLVVGAFGNHFQDEIKQFLGRWKGSER